MGSHVLDTPVIAQYEAARQELSLSGSASLRTADELAPWLGQLKQAIDGVHGVLHLNVRRLTQMSEAAFDALARVIVDACSARPDFRVVIVTSSVVGWSTRAFRRLAEAEPAVSVEEYDSVLYPGQSFQEEGGFIPILRNQTKLTWPHERDILPRHGMQPGIAMADICCGIGDFALLVKKEFNPSRIVALDHSRSSLSYARDAAMAAGLTGIEYRYGDAAEMLLETGQFDLVTCRHALQIFNRPDLILRELYRICKPGGRVYITNEKNSHCFGEPYAESIQWTYQEVAKLFRHFQMDVEFGPKSRSYLVDAGFEEIEVETFTVTNLDGDLDFAAIVAAWEEVYAGEMAVKRGDSPEFIERLRRGFQDHILAALDPKGYTGWPIWAASGRKPLQSP